MISFVLPLAGMTSVLCNTALGPRMPPKPEDPQPLREIDKAADVSAIITYL
jgi:hypothetical protein